MDLLRRGERRRGRVATALTTVTLLGAFQVLAIVGAGVAFATGTCTYNPATDTINITIDAGTSVSVAVETAADDLDAESPPGAILFAQVAFGDYENGAASTQCGSASTSNTVAIVVLGQPSSDEVFLIDEETSTGQFPSTIAWAIDLGSNSVGGFDEFRWWSTDGTVRDDTATVTDTTFDINGGIGELVGVESQWLYGAAGDDVIDASGVANAVVLVNGGDGDDWIAAGAQAPLPFPLGFGDVYNGQGDYDTLSYGTRTTSTTVDVPSGFAGRDANADCDLVDPGDEQDDISTFEAYETGSGNDCLVGNGGDEWFVPGDGDDYVEGQAGDDDVVDFSTSSTAMTIDPDAGTATGQGSDELVDIFGFVGSDFDDVLIWDSSVWGFAGGDGVDTVDASANTTAQFIDLDTLDDIFTADSTENAIGGSGDDDLDGNDLRNVLSGNDGNDELFGWGGNDTFFGGLGNDDFTGGDGADTVDFGASPNGIDADVSLGFATGEGDDSIAGIEIVKGSAFKDSIVGGGGVTAANFRITGRAGNDILTGSGSNDYLKGGAGNDKLRGLEGGDTLLGGKGKDTAWGGSGTDVCKGAEKEKGCEI